MATLETPCEEAAAILAQLSGYTDLTLTLTALGCRGTSDCLVKNVDLFQMMDEMA